MKLFPHRLVAVVAAMALTLGVAGMAKAEDKLILGVAGAHSGDLAPFGLPTVNAAKLVVEAVNAKGGVLGKMVEVDAQDDQCKPEMAANAATKLISDKAAVVIGHICSGATKAALPIYRDAKIVLMSPSATSTALTYSGEYPNFFRTIGADVVQGDICANFVMNKLGAKHVAIIHDKGEYGKGYAEAAKATITKAGKAKVALFEGITTGAVDYSAAITKVLQSKADVVIFGGYHPEASKLISGMRKKGIKAAFVGPDGINGNDFIKIAGADAEGVYASGPEIYDNPMAKKAIEDHKAKFGSEPGMFFLQGYAAAQSLLAAIEKAGSTDYAKVTEALRTNPVDTVIGKIKFDKKGDAEGVGFSMYQVKSGKFEAVK